MAELDEAAIGIPNAAAVAHRERLVAGRPNQAIVAAGSLGDRIDFGPSLEGEPQMSVVVGTLGSRIAAAEQDQDELLFTAGLGQPGHLATIATMDDLESAIGSVKLDGGSDVAGLQGEMREDRSHVVSLRCR
jgi:hypothetical protein